MNRRELAGWRTEHLARAEPLDRPPELANPQETAITATKKLALLGIGSGDFYRQALQVKSPQDCAAVLMDCLSALTENLDTESPQPAGGSKPRSKRCGGPCGEQKCQTHELVFPAGVL